MADDDLGIVYLIDNAQQFWSVLEDIVEKPQHIPTLQQLDSSLKRFLQVCITHHEQYLQTPFQMEHAFGLVLDSELFTFHSTRMEAILLSDLQSNTDPHLQFITYSLFLSYGRRKHEFLKSEFWDDLLPLLMDHVLVDIESDSEDAYLAAGPGSSQGSSILGMPIESKLRAVGVQLMYEVCKQQTFSVPVLRLFNTSFIESLFEIVEETRHMQDESFNYDVIKLIIGLSEQFMVASLTPQSGSAHEPGHHQDLKNRVLRVLVARQRTSTTFGQNLIFMLNRARSAESILQLQVLKFLYLLFTTPATMEFFYTNDLKVLVDVIVRHLVDMEDESLRNTYLRVLEQLLTNTQLRNMHYKRSEVVSVLESLLADTNIGEISSTTKRLAQRCLGVSWCAHLSNARDLKRPTSPSNESVISSTSQTRSRLAVTTVQTADKPKTLKSSKSVEFKSTASSLPASPMSGIRSSNGSSFDLSSARPPPPRPARKGTSNSLEATSNAASIQPIRDKASSTGPVMTSAASPATAGTNPSLSLSPAKRRAAPPPPSKQRRKPPAIPVGVTNGGATISAIKVSSSRAS